MSNFPGVAPQGFPPGMPARKAHRGGLILGLGAGGLAITLLGCVGNFSSAPCGLVSLISLALSIVAWIMANGDLRDMAAGVMDRAGEGSTRAGKVCAIINVIFAILTIVFMLLVMLGLLAALGIVIASGNNP